MSDAFAPARRAAIVGRFVKVTAPCDGDDFGPRTRTEYFKYLEMQIKEGQSGLVVQFIGGPTGFESYYVNSLLENMEPDTEELCICAGTVNSWHECYVPYQQVADFIRPWYRPETSEKGDE